MDRVYSTLQTLAITGVFGAVVLGIALGQIIRYV